MKKQRLEEKTDKTTARCGCPGPTRGRRPPPRQQKNGPWASAGRGGRAPRRWQIKKSGLVDKPLFLLKQGAPAGFTRACGTMPACTSLACGQPLKGCRYVHEEDDPLLCRADLANQQPVGELAAVLLHGPGGGEVQEHWLLLGEDAAEIVPVAKEDGDRAPALLPTRSLLPRQPPQADDRRDGALVAANAAVVVGQAGKGGGSAPPAPSLPRTPVQCRNKTCPRAGRTPCQMAARLLASCVVSLQRRFD